MNSKVKSKIKILLILGILFALSPMISTNLSFITGNSNRSSEYSDNFNKDNKNLQPSKISTPIHIDDTNPAMNWSVAKDAGICTGNGTYSDPYVIEDLVIDGGGSGNCILIENSDVYVRIENCTVYKSGNYPNAGIWLSNVNNSHIIDNDCSFNANGIFLDYINNNTISGNTANNNEHGIRLYKSDYNAISGNTVSSNEDHGIRLSGSDNNDISGNTVNNNDGSGICLEGCDNNDILGNTANNNYNGVYLSSGLINMEVRGCYNNIISENTANNNDGSGICLEWCDNNIISENTANNNYDYGIHLWYSDNNTISGNVLLENDECIVEENCEGNVFENNDCGGISLELIIIISSISGGAVIGVATFLLIRRKRKRIT